MRGPAGVVRDQAAGVTLRSTLTVGEERLVVSYPWRRLHARLTGTRITQNRADFPVG